MKRVFSILSIIMVWASVVVLNGKVIPFPAVNKPLHIAVAPNHIYVSEKFKVHVFSRVDYSFVRTFGREGEGPGEFALSVVPKPVPGGLMALSFGKVLFYTADGGLISEKRAPIHFYSSARLLSGDRYVALQSNVAPVKSLWIYDAAFNPVVELYREKKAHSPVEFFGTLFIFAASHDKIFIAKENRFPIGIYNTSGKETGTISGVCQPEPFTQAHREEVFRRLKALNASDEVLKRQKKMFVFPEHFPCVRTLTVDGEKLYIGVHFGGGEEKLYLVYHTDGAFLEKVFARIRYYDNGDLFSYPGCISGSDYYQLIENDVSGDWELHITPLRPARRQRLVFRNILFK